MELPNVFTLRPRPGLKAGRRLDAGKIIAMAKNLRLSYRLDAGKIIHTPQKLGPRHRLDAGKVIETAKNLAADINVRLSGTNLAVLAEELARLAVATEERAGRARRPFLAIRAFSTLAISLVLLGLWNLARHIHTRWEFGTIKVGRGTAWMTFPEARKRGGVLESGPLTERKGMSFIPFPRAAGLSDRRREFVQWESLAILPTCPTCAEPNTRRHASGSQQTSEFRLR
jgi:hypothetical protein